MKHTPLKYTSWKEANEAIRAIADASEVDSLHKYYLVTIMYSDRDETGWINAYGSYRPVGVNAKEKSPFLQKGDAVHVEDKGFGKLGQGPIPTSGGDLWTVTFEDGSTMWIGEDRIAKPMDSVDLDALQLAEVYDEIEREDRQKATDVLKAMGLCDDIKSLLEGL